MTTTPVPAFPIDDLVTYAKCGNQATLNKDPEQQYHCYLSCSLPIRARELNAYLIPKITSAVITETTFPALKDRFLKALTKTPARHQYPSDDEIRGILHDPNTFLTEGAAPAAAELLSAFVDRIELNANRATIRYAMPLPRGSALARSTVQEVHLPDSLMA